MRFRLVALNYFLAVAQWIVHMPPKRGIQVRFLSAGPEWNKTYPQLMWINPEKFS